MFEIQPFSFEAFQNETKPPMWYFGPIYCIVSKQLPSGGLGNSQKEFKDVGFKNFQNDMGVANRGGD